MVCTFLTVYGRFGPYRYKAELQQVVHHAQNTNVLCLSGTLASFFILNCQPQGTDKTQSQPEGGG